MRRACNCEPLACMRACMHAGRGAHATLPGPFQRLPLAMGVFVDPHPTPDWSMARAPRPAPRASAPPLDAPRSRPIPSPPAPFPSLTLGQGHAFDNQQMCDLALQRGWGPAPPFGAVGLGFRVLARRTLRLDA